MGEIKIYYGIDFQGEEEIKPVVTVGEDYGPLQQAEAFGVPVEEMEEVTKPLDRLACAKLGSGLGHTTDLTEQE